MKQIFTYSFLMIQLCLGISHAQQNSGLTSFNVPSKTISIGSPSNDPAFIRTKEEVSLLLSGTLTATRYENQRIALKTESSWVGDSLQVVYEFHRMTTELDQEKSQLIERITYRFRLEDIRRIEIDTDEFNFVQLSIGEKKNEIYSLQERFADGEYEEDYRFTAAFPVKTENLDQLQRLFRSLQHPL